MQLPTSDKYGSKVYKGPKLVVRFLLLVAYLWLALILLDKFTSIACCGTAMELAPGTLSWTLCWTLQSNTAILATLTDEKIMEELEQIGVAQLVIKLQGTGTMRLYFLLISGCLKPLPRKGSAEEVHKGMGKQLQTIVLSLLHTQVARPMSTMLTWFCCVRVSWSQLTVVTERRLCGASLGC